jgi:hypothetical protein
MKDILELVKEYRELEKEVEDINYYFNPNDEFYENVLLIIYMRMGAIKRKIDYEANAILEFNRSEKIKELIKK